MANFTAKDVMDLRGRTGCGMMDCKKALTECEGDVDKAIDYLREKGLAKAAKKQSRIAAEGIVGSYICDKCGTGAIVEVNCETDFVRSTATTTACTSPCSTCRVTSVTASRTAASRSARPSAPRT